MKVGVYIGRKGCDMTPVFFGGEYNINNFKKCGLDIVSGPLMEI